MKPEGMSNKWNSAVFGTSIKNSFLILFINIKQISLSKERLWDPIVCIHSIYSYWVLFSIDYHSFVETSLINSVIKKPVFILVSSFNNLNLILIDLSNSCYCPVISTCIAQKCPICRLSPINFIQVMFWYYVLVVFESENHLFLFVLL